MFDLVIRGGEVVGGTGRARRIADVGITGGRIRSIGSLDEAGRQVIDASGAIVALGFVDVHTHYDAQAFFDPTLSLTPLHGVTTVFGGNCGFSIAPMVAGSAEYLMKMLARTEGMPLCSLKEGLPWDWSSMADYLDRLVNRLAINAGFMVGHTAVRSFVLGDAAVERFATDDEI